MPIIKKIENSKPNNNWLKAFGKDVTSQCGEDGILEKIFSIIPNPNRTCVELGAWDGKLYSNTWNLIQNENWSAVLIEANPEKFLELKKVHGKKSVQYINRFVQLSGPESLDEILKTSNLEKKFGFLSLDIDGNEYHVWKSLKDFSPQVVVIEFNMTIPNDVIYIQDPDFRLNQGCSLSAIVALAKEKGYELVATTSWNAFFVLSEYFPLFKIEDNSVDRMYTEDQYQTRIFQLFDGTLQIAGCKKLLWHNIEISEEDIQVLPRAMRVFSDAQA